MEGSRIDTTPLIFSYDTDLAKKSQGGVLIHVAPGPQVDEGAWLKLEGSRIDANPLSFSFDTDLAKKGQGGVIVQVAPGPQVNEQAWLELIRTESDHDIARRLGITDRQVRRIKKGKVSVARLREHAEADPKHKK